jgi:hypothetical protein
MVISRKHLLKLEVRLDHKYSEGEKVLSDRAYEIWLSQAEKLDYSLVTLTFAIIALSFQFSPGMGNQWPWVLIVSWCFYLLSTLFGGLRLIRIVTHSRINQQRLQIKEFISQRITDIASGQVEIAAEYGRLLDSETGKPITLEILQAGLKLEQEKLKKAEKVLDQAGKYMAGLFRSQFWCLVVGLFLNGAFAAKNLLEKSI